MLKAFKEHIETNFPELLNNHFLIASSGGLDSTVLTVLCHHAELSFSIGHCNFNLRGKDSEEDERFVAAFATKLNRPFYVARFNTTVYVKEHKVSVQMAARELRYNWFDTILKEQKIAFVLTAHHANDSVETFLINLSRGTGIDGLTGIPAKHNTIRRPLLPFSREALYTFAKEQKLDWREDASNKDAKYLRNKIRLDIIPELNQLHPTFLTNFKNTQKYLQQSQILATQFTERLKKELFILEGDKYKISVVGLQELNPLEAFLPALFKDYGFKEWQNVADLLSAKSGKYVQSKTHVLVKNRKVLWLSPILKNTKDSYLLEEHSKATKVPIQLVCSIVKERKDNTDVVVYLAKNLLEYPLTIRKWQEGDYFYPLGLNKKKKLSKFFKDEKMSLLEKQEQWLLCSNSKIVWVIGKRADHRFSVLDNSSPILKIEWIK